MQLAIAMSQEEAEREKQRSCSEEVRLQMALKQSEKGREEYRGVATGGEVGTRTHHV